MDILTFLRDPFWQFAGFFVAFVAVVVSVILYLRQRSVKALTYEILTEVVLIGVDKSVKNRVKISFDDMPVSSLYLFRFRLVNSGNKAILPDDYIQQVTVNMGSETRILSALIESTYPQNLGTRISANEQTGEIIFQPVLLNSGDSVLVQVLLDGPWLTYRFEGRIVDVKEIKEGGRQGTVTKTLYALMFASCVIAGSIGWDIFKSSGSWPLAALITAMICSFIILLPRFITSDRIWGSKLLRLR